MRAGLTTREATVKLNADATSEVHRETWAEFGPLPGLRGPDDTIGLTEDVRRSANDLKEAPPLVQRGDVPQPNDSHGYRWRNDASTPEKIGVEPEHVAVARSPTKHRRCNRKMRDGVEVFKSAVEAPSLERDREPRCFLAKRFHRD